MIRNFKNVLMYVFVVDYFKAKKCAFYRNLDLRKPYYTKDSEYESSFEEISLPFNEKIFKIRKRKSKEPADNDSPRIHFAASRERSVVLLSCGFLMYRYTSCPPIGYLSTTCCSQNPHGTCPLIRKFQDTKSPPERINFVSRGITVIQFILTARQPV